MNSTNGDERTSVFVKMMDSQKIAGTSVSTTNYPMTNHVGHRDDRRTHGALCTGTYIMCIRSHTIHGSRGSRILQEDFVETAIPFGEPVSGTRHPSEKDLQPHGKPFQFTYLCRPFYVFLFLLRDLWFVSSAHFLFSPRIIWRKVEVPRRLRNGIGGVIKELCIIVDGFTSHYIETKCMTTMKESRDTNYEENYSICVWREEYREYFLV